MAGIRGFEELVAWQKGHRLAVDVYRTTKPCLRQDFDLCRQARRSAVSVVSNVAEGFERFSPAEFGYFLGVARGSAGELRAQLRLMQDLGYLPGPSVEPLILRSTEVSRIIAGLAASLRR
ncbi:four helix bundle protein [Sediminicurvatus halobius]|uniref:Four helix bundle protein n=1 Tax=Sediminicurvatus halobius TaxID=2182432 RepID=A0A2U2MZI7_9GAMM|nr:four helix bundle protein [Spiribacter halobius]